MAHAQKPDFVFPLNGRVHLNRWGRQFSRLLATEVCASAWVMLDRPRSEVAWEYWLPTPFASFPFTSPPVRHRVPSGSAQALLISVRGWVDPKATVRPEMKNSNDTIGNWTSDLPTCGAVSQPTAPPRTPPQVTLPLKDVSNWNFVRIFHIPQASY